MKHLLLLMFLPVFTSAQELVTDPGFEALKRCPVGISMLHNSAYWFSPTNGTPDLFNKCGGNRTMVGVPRNTCGKQTPYEGDGYAGLILYENVYFDYKE